MRLIPQEIFDFFLPIYRKHKKYFLLLILSSVVSGATSVLMPLLLKAETDQLAHQYSLDILGTIYTPFVVFITILGIIFLTHLISTTITSVIRIYSSAQEDYIKNSLQYAIFSRMKNMEVGNVLMGRFHRLSTLIDDSINSLSHTFLSFPADIIRKIIEATGLTLIFAYFDIRLLGVVCVTAILGYFLRSLSEKMSKKYELSWKFSLGRKQYFYSDLFLNNFPQLAMNGAVESSLNHYQAILQEEVKNGIQNDWSHLRYHFFDSIISSTGEILIKLIVGYGVFAGTNSIGMVTLVIASMSTIESLFRDVLYMRVNYQKFRMDIHSALLFLKMTQTVGNIDTYKQPLKSITLKNLHFTYPNVVTYEREYLEIVQNFIGKKISGSTYIQETFDAIIREIQEASQESFHKTLKGISFSFEVGKLYGIVGRNGAGKTTLVQLLAGFFRNYEGEIRFNEANIRDWKPELIARYISFLTQEPFYLGYGATIRENLLFGASITDESILWKYLEDFELAKKIRKTKRGLDAEIGDDIEFSGGERQLLAFIRLLLQDKPIVILDEGSNQLDAENETRMLNALLEKQKEKIIIFITHRMSTISRADEIFTIENGSIAHRGNHSSLLVEKENLYAKFYEAQVLHHQ